MVFETDRLILREYVMEDFDALFEILSDTETMQHYPAPFDEDKTKGWINWNLDNYKEYGFGLWAVVASYSTAIANGMQKVKEYPDPQNIISYAYAITREEWQKIKEDEIAVAKDEDVLEISNGLLEQNKEAYGVLAE